MSPNDIHKSLIEIRDSFPKPSQMQIAFISTPGTKSTFDNAFERTVAATTKNGWGLDNKPATKTFVPADSSVIDYVQSIAQGAASQSRTNVLVIIDMNAPLTSVWVTRGSSCFIATAAYGSALAPEVAVLSRFRDDILMCSKFGRLMVRIYYYLSPPMASAIDSSAPARLIVRTLLHPLVRLVRVRLRFRSTQEPSQKKETNYEFQC